MFSQDVERVIKGKLSCDCTRSLLIRQYCDDDFPILKCGNEITVVSVMDVEAAAAPAMSRTA